MDRMHLKSAILVCGCPGERNESVVLTKQVVVLSWFSKENKAEIKITCKKSNIIQKAKLTLSHFVRSGKHFEFGQKRDPVRVCSQNSN